METTKTTNFGIVFLVAAVLVLIFALDVVWWAAILVALLARADLKIITTERNRWNA